MLAKLVCKLFGHDPQWSGFRPDFVIRIRCRRCGQIMHDEVIT